MPLTSRRYANAHDLDLMKDMLRAGKQAYPYSGLHIGDLDWWVFYDTSGVPLTDKVRPWFEGKQLIAWAWLRLGDNEYDLFVHPAYRGTPQQEVVMLGTIDELSAHARQQPRDGADQPQITGYADDDETAHMALLERLGFSRSEAMIHFAQDIRGALPTPVLPAGFTFLGRIDPEDAERRALAHKDAFQPKSKMSPDHYRAFMNAPGYDPELDIAVAAADGTILSFAMAWMDEDNKLSEFEPVGTRHAFQRRGLGKATLLEGLHRLQARGVNTALVSCDASEPGNISFYQAAGFQICGRVLEFTKVLE
jgi:ribosomal protein S18 acetylase RimI-like enzyme